MLPYLYFLKVILCSSILLGYYFLVLRNKVYHQYNRFYLLFAVVLSWGIPLMHFKISVEEPKVTPTVLNVINYLNNDSYANVSPVLVKSEIVASPIFTFENISIFVFALVALVVLLSAMKVFWLIIKLKRQYKFTIYDDYKLYFTKDPSTPFSFFNSIFWNDNIQLETALGKQILQHEIIHIQEKHSWDKLFIQINLMVGWFNPMFWILRNELDMIHEFIADKKSVPNASTEAFAQMILNTAFVGSKTPLTNPFFFSPIKRRLLMLTKNKHPKFSYAQRVSALPLAIILIAVLSIQAKKVMANHFPHFDKQLEKAFNPKVFSENKELIVSDLPLENEATSEAIITGGASEAELNEYYVLIAKAFKVAEEAYDFSLLNDLEKNRIIAIVEKMDDKQKLKIPVNILVIDNKKPPFELEEVNNVNWAKWKINANYTMMLDNKPTDKEFIFKNYTASNFKFFQTLELYTRSDNPSENKYQINLFSNEFYSNVMNRPVKKKLVSNSHQLISSNGTNEASEDELLEMMGIFKKYSPFKPTTATTTNGITQEEHDRALALYNKMSSQQKVNSPIIFQPRSINLESQPLETLQKNSNLQPPSQENLQNWANDSTSRFYLDGVEITHKSIATFNPSSLVDAKQIVQGNVKLIILFTASFFEKNKKAELTKDNSQMIIGNYKKRK